MTKNSLASLECDIEDKKRELQQMVSSIAGEGSVLAPVGKFPSNSRSLV